ncbi:RNA recognition motif-containing protein 19 [Elsinoe australis]|uniref:RNA recognition motif-containing protein 19 n=1 Tax=Elsinoe australis TaxID=40998 RepID=A0A4U7B0P1_9PEZI|nr:RNA recognition motif-containing protein 19 [Elsinoe australis]
MSSRISKGVNADLDEATKTTFDNLLTPDGKMSVNEYKRPTEGYKMLASASEKPTSASSSSSVSSTTHPTLSLDEPSVNLAKLDINDNTMPSIASNSGVTHFVEFSNLHVTQADALVNALNKGILDRIIRTCDGDCLTMWFVVDDLVAAEALLDQSLLFGTGASRCVSDSEALNFLGIDKPYFNVAIPKDRSVNIARPFGQIEVALTPVAPLRNEMQVHIAAEQLAKAYGPTLYVQYKGRLEDGSFSYIIAYERISSVQQLLKSLGVEASQPITKDFTAVAKPKIISNKVIRYEDRPSKPTAPAANSANPEMFFSPTGRTAWVGDKLIPAKHSQPATPANNYPVQTMPYSTMDPYANYTPGSAMSAMTPGYGMDTYSQRGHIMSGPGRRRERINAARQSQDVEIMAIEDGTDVRTTLMIRNLPNRFGFEDVKQILDVTSKGHYDFLYVRMDFANSCNVGYAFVNFVRPEFIVPFFKTRVHKPWPGVPTDKFCEVSYATIQGQDCLIQKFRNSSVMAEYVAFRPKLLYTVDSIDVPADKSIGDEAPFPESDNKQKFSRSIDNAKTIGLYPPRGLKGGREARRPHSQFDRGTSGAMADEAAYFQRIGRRYPPGPGFGSYVSSPLHSFMSPADYGPVAPPTHGQLQQMQSVPRYFQDPTQVYQAMPNAGAYYTPTRQYPGPAVGIFSAPAKFGTNYRW